MKQKIKQFLLRGIILCEIVPALILSVPLILLGLIADWFARYSEVSILASRIPFFLGEYTRYFYYKCTLLKMGRKVTFKYGSFCQYRSAAIGNHVHIGYFNALGEIEIGDNVLIGGFVNMLSGRRQHALQRQEAARQDQAFGREKVHIGSDVWIGSNCVIAADIEERCVIGAGSVLVRKALAGTVYAGNPAKALRKLEGSDNDNHQKPGA